MRLLSSCCRRAVSYWRSVQRINVLEDDELRQGIKDFSDWPTIPQLYVKGEFVGGCDIIREMYETGELLEMLNTHGINVQPGAQA